MGHKGSYIDVDCSAVRTPVGCCFPNESPTKRSRSAPPYSVIRFGGNMAEGQESACDDTVGKLLI